MKVLRKGSLTALLVSGAILTLAGLSGCASHRTYPGPVHGLSFNGTIQSIDLTNQSLALSPLKPGEPIVFAWNKTTKFWKNGVPIRPEEVEGGKSVRVHFHFTGNQRVAHHVYVSVPYAPLH